MDTLNDSIDSAPETEVVEDCDVKDDGEVSQSEYESISGTQADSLREVDNIHRGLQRGDPELGLGSIILTCDQKVAAETLGHKLGTSKGKKALEGFDRILWKNRKDIGLLDWTFENGTSEESLTNILTDSEIEKGAGKLTSKESRRAITQPELHTGGFQSGIASTNINSAVSEANCTDPVNCDTENLPSGYKNPSGPMSTYVIGSPIHVEDKLNCTLAGGHSSGFEDSVALTKTVCEPEQRNGEDLQESTKDGLLVYPSSDVCAQQPTHSGVGCEIPAAKPKLVSAWDVLQMSRNSHKTSLPSASNLTGNGNEKSRQTATQEMPVVGDILNTSPDAVAPTHATHQSVDMERSSRPPAKRTELQAPGVGAHTDTVPDSESDTDIIRRQRLDDDEKKRKYSGGYNGQTAKRRLCTVRPRLRTASERKEHQLRLLSDNFQKMSKVFGNYSNRGELSGQRLVRVPAPSEKKIDSRKDGTNGSEYVVHERSGCYPKRKSMSEEKRYETSMGKEAKHGVLAKKGHPGEDSYEFQVSDGPTADDGDDAGGPSLPPHEKKTKSLMERRTRRSSLHTFLPFKPVSDRSGEDIEAKVAEQVRQPEPFQESAPKSNIHQAPETVEKHEEVVGEPKTPEPSNVSAVTMTREKKASSITNGCSKTHLCAREKLSGAEQNLPEKSNIFPQIVRKRNIRWAQKSFQSVRSKEMGGHKTLYASFSLGNQEIKENDCVELDPAPGEDRTRIARIEALWSETPQDENERMFARIRRFYRPGEVCVPVATTTGEIFSTDHIDERVSLHAVIGPCHVEFLGYYSQNEPARPGYTCRLHYHQEEGTIATTRLGPSIKSENDM